MTKSLLITTLLGSIFLSPFGFSNTAEAGYAITLDNRGTGGVPTWAGTGGTITVKTKINGTWATVCELTPNFLSENIWCYSNVFDWDDVDGVWIQTNSSNGFWLDQYHLWQITGPFTADLKRTVGVDNNAGWCFSNGSESPSQFCAGSWSSGWFWTF